MALIGYCVFFNLLIRLHFKENVCNIVKRSDLNINSKKGGWNDYHSVIRNEK